MTRYIDADVLRTVKSIQSADFNTIETIQKWIDEAPTTDAVEVVRCGECKYLYTDGRCDAFADFSVRPSASDFCSYGKRWE